MITYTAASSPTSIELTPNIPAIGSIIWLHGLGADGHDFTSMAAQLNLPLRFIFPHAPLRPVTINNGYVMRAWFDIYSMQMDQRIDLSGIGDSVKQVEQLIENECDKGIATEKIILGGFSQGAVIALTAGLTHAKKLAGIIALSGYFPNAAQVLSTNHSNKKTPIFLAHGTEDTIVPFALAQATAAALEKSSLSVAWHSYKMPHSVCAEEVRDIAGWLAKQIT